MENYRVQHVTYSKSLRHPGISHTFSVNVIFCAKRMILISSFYAIMNKCERVNSTGSSEGTPLYYLKVTWRLLRRLLEERPRPCCSTKTRDPIFWSYSENTFPFLYVFLYFLPSTFGEKSQVTVIGADRKDCVKGLWLWLLSRIAVI